jgi:hypothetical protein
MSVSTELARVLDTSDQSLPTAFDDAPAWAVDLYRQGLRTEKAMTVIAEVIERVGAEVEPMVPEILSIIERAQNHPMLRMILGVKK